MLESASILSKIEALREEYTTALAKEMSGKCIKIVPDPIEPDPIVPDPIEFEPITMPAEPVVTIESDFVAYHKALDKNAPVKVGEIFRASWGYSMTIVDYYVISEISKTGKSVKLRPIGGKILTGGGMAGTIMPDPKVSGSSVHLGKSNNFKRLKEGYNGGWRVGLGDYASAYRWEGTVDSYNRMD